MFAVNLTTAMPAPDFLLTGENFSEKMKKLQWQMSKIQSNRRLKGIGTNRLYII